MKQIAIICCLCLFLVDMSIGQMRKTNLNEKNISFARKISSAQIKKRTKIQGEHFLNKEWKKGMIHFRDSSLDLNPTDIRYFVVSQEMHFIRQNDTLSISASNLINTIFIGDQKFICTAYKTKTNQQFGFFQELCSGNTRLLKKYSIKLIEGTKYAKNSFQSITPDKYRIKTSYFIQTENKPAVKLKLRLKEFLKSLPSNQHDTYLYIKQHNLKLKREANLINILEYYNSVINPNK